MQISKCKYLPYTVANVYEDKKQSDQHGHPEIGSFQRGNIIFLIIWPARDHLRFYQETDPAYYHKHGTGKVHLKQEDFDIVACQKLG